MGREWIAELLGPQAWRRLIALSGSELQSVLLEVYRERAKRRGPAEVLEQQGRDSFVAPARVDQRVGVELDAHLLAAAHAFEAVELSPVAPLGTCASVAVTDQNRVLSASRNTEVVSDPTNVLALLCAQRLKAGRAPAHLATSHRVMRAQPVPKGVAGYTQHFRMFVLASGGLETSEHAFTVDTLVQHIRTLLAALDRLEQHGYAFGARRVEVLATPERAHLGERIAAAVGATRGPLEHAYYAGLRFRVHCGDKNVADGGAFDWLQKLAANRRAVFVASGAGSELMATTCRPAAR